MRFIKCRAFPLNTMASLKNLMNMIVSVAISKADKISVTFQWLGESKLP